MRSQSARPPHPKLTPRQHAQQCASLSRRNTQNERTHTIGPGQYWEPSTATTAGHIRPPQSESRDVAVCPSADRRKI